MTKRRISDLVLVLVLFAIYAAGAMTLAVVGSNTYRHTTAVMQRDYDLRTGVLYLAEKIRQNDVGGGVRLDEVNGSEALVLTEQLTGKGYETWIFLHDGQLCEELIASGMRPDMAQAQRIMPMQSMHLALNSQGLLEAALITPDDVASSIVLNIKCGDRAFPSATALSASDAAPSAAPESASTSAAPSPAPAPASAPAAPSPAPESASAPAAGGA
ncbi:MAG: DUF4860 domain-containing protein [Coriobacteriales bacterium]|jgi:hypothetical protein|nr:DUF4860 domain-containing protein [Coriobacteriales bacterium]